MANKIQIKRSTTNAAPAGLANGELAYTSNGEILFLGHPDGTTGSIAIGGLRNPGTLTANQALVANSTSGIDKVIVANLVPTAIYANGASGSAGQYLTSNATGGVYWSAPTAGVAGSNTQVQFNDSGVLAGDAGLTFDKTTDTLSAGKIAVVNATTSSNTTTGALTVAGGLGVAGRINTSEIATGNDSVYSTLTGTALNTANVFATGTVNASVISVGAWVVANNGGVYTSGIVNGDILAVGSAVRANTSGVFTTGTVNGAVVGVGTQFFANTTQVSLSQGMKLSANGALGSANQVLRSDGAGTAYWSDDTGDISEVVAGAGLTDGGTSGSVTLNVGAGAGITVNADDVAVKANSGIVANSTGVFVNANNGIIANSTGVFADAANGISVDSSGINVLRGDGTLTVNATGVYVNTANLSVATSQLSGDVALGTQTSGNYVATITAGNGISGGVTGEGSTPTIAVVANNGIVANSTGVFVNANNGIIANSSGVFADAANGISVDASGINVTAGDGLVANASGVHVVAANGISVAADSVGVTTGSTLTVNSTGIHVNSSLSITDLTVSGNLDINGTLTTVDTTNLSVTDSIISLARANAVDTLDIGFYGTFNDGATKYSGLFRDATDGVYRLFAGAIPEPTTTVDTANVNFAYATLQSYLTTGALVANSSVVNITANSTVSVALTANSLSLTTALPATSGGTGTASYTSGDLLVANTGNTLSKLALGTDGKVLQSNGTAVIYADLDGGTF